MPRMPMSPCNHCSTPSSAPNASENLKLKILEDKLRNDLAEKEHTHEQYLTEENIKDLATEQFVEEKVNNIVFPETDLTGYATEEWVENKKYLTEHQDISGKQDNIEDLEEIREGAALGKTALQEVPAEYITEEELEAKQYLTEHQDISHLAEKDHVHDQYLTEHQSLDGYAKESFVEQKVTELVDSAPEALNTLNELAIAINNHEDAYDALLETVGKKADQSEIDSVNTKIEENTVLYNNLNDKVDDLNIPTKVSELENDLGYLTEVPTTVYQYKLPYPLDDNLDLELDANLIEFANRFIAGENVALYVYWDGQLFSTHVQHHPANINGVERDCLHITYYNMFAHSVKDSKYEGFSICTNEIQLRKDENNLDWEGAKFKYNPDTDSDFLPNYTAVDTLIKEAVEDIEHPANPTKVSELENDANYTNETKVLELIENNASSKIGISFTTDITVGHLEAGTNIPETMTISELLKKILVCEHEWEAADCDSPRVCKLCGLTDGEALGHTEEILAGYAATCTETGLTEGKKCAVCGEILVEQEAIDVLGHEYISEVTKAATCEETGIITYSCSRCGESYTEEIPMLSHIEKTKVENNIDPSCETAGSYDTITYCEICNEELNRITTSVEALGHNYGDWVITKEAEVGVPGEQQKTCSRCGDIITEEISALEPEEPTTINYYLGAIGNDSKQDDPDLWGELEEAGYASMNPATRAEFYFNEMQNNDARSIEPASLVGQHELSWKLTTPTGLDEDLSEVFEEDTYLEDTDQVYPAIALPSNYKVSAWSTDAENAYPVVDVIGEIEMTNNYTVYYAKNAFPFNAVKTFFITIETK